MSANKFDPSSEIKRRDAMALLMRTAQLVVGDIPETNLAFADNAEIADYAKKVVSYVTVLRLFKSLVK